MNILQRFLCSLFGDFCTCCHKTRTKNPSGTCDFCEEDAFVQKKMEEMKKQRDIICPIDDEIMKPEIILVDGHRKIIFICHVCHHVLIQEGDLELIEREAITNSIFAMDIRNAIYRNNCGLP